MKHIFFDNQNAANLGANNPVVINAGMGVGNIVFGGGINVINLVGNNGGAIQFGAGIKVIGNGDLMDPIVAGAIVTINNPETTTLDLANIGLTDGGLQLICNHLPSNQNIEFINFSNNPITAHGVEIFINTPGHSVVSADFSLCPTIMINENFHVMHQTIYQSPLISCVFNEFNLLGLREKNAADIMNTLYTMLTSFDTNSHEERETLIKFISSPTAQKALKWLSENSVELGHVGEKFIFFLNKMANENMFYLKGVCKEFQEESFFYKLAPESLFKILSYLDFLDILPTPGPVIEEVDMLGSSSQQNLFQSIEDDSDLYS